MRGANSDDLYASRLYLQEPLTEESVRLGRAYLANVANNANAGGFPRKKCCHKRGESESKQYRKPSSISQEQDMLHLHGGMPQWETCIRLRANMRKNRERKGWNRPYSDHSIQIYCFITVYINLEQSECARIGFQERRTLTLPLSTSTNASHSNTSGNSPSLCQSKFNAREQY